MGVGVREVAAVLEFGALDPQAKAGLDFVRKYRTTLVDNATVGVFQRELEGIGAAVSKRMQREEEVLYPLYRTM